MMTTQTRLSAIVAGALLTIALSLGATVSNADATVNAQDLRTRGAIASLQQHDESQYILQGYWKLKYIDDESYFHAKFTMVNVDGTNHHTMWLKQFRPSTDPVVDGDTVTYEGTIDIWAYHPEMMPAPAIIEDGNDVPVEISIINNNVIAIQIDHDVNEHFGDTPIYGTISKSTA
jgi:hypothetical protein